MSEGTAINTGYVDPVNDLGALLLEVEKPARYTGGEYGRLARRDAPLQTLIAFPDLYEIGMSNQALRIIYNGLNRIPGVSCDRAFAPAPDFERLLRERGLPLYGLDTGVSLKNLDLLLFTLGYELGISGILAILDVSGIPLRSDQRGEHDPLIIAGGPAVSNPLPYSAFIDAFWIGEAEAGFFDLAQELLTIRQNGGSRAALFERIKNHPHIWVKGKERAVRAVDSCFARRETASSLEVAVYPVPSMKTVQHHGILEIMRGCPNGCRFCHAGYWYRPMRQKTQDALVREAEAFITRGGYREISLSSLSSGDYAGIGELVDALNRRFSGRHVSFQLPSLRVSSFSLSLLEKISQTRKSGLTFAVETPRDFWQLAINKQVTEDSVVEILKEAKRNGWRGAKFYFMIGLPVPAGEYSEEVEIVNFITAVARKTSMHFNVNVGIFVPKPHTPYQWARQIDSESAAAKLEFIRSRLKPLGHKVSVSDPFVSMLEGILSRGDARAGDLVEQAFRAGSRLDAWQEFIAKDVWRGILEHHAALTGEFLAEKNIEAPPPWQHILSGVSSAYLRTEFEKSHKAALSPPCAENCTAPCGVCKRDTGIMRNENSCGAESPEHPPEPENTAHSDPAIWRLLFSFTKEGSAVFHGHLSLIEIFSMAMGRAGLDVLYTQGFNPLAKMEIVSPLSIGIAAGAEMAAVEFSHEFSPGEFTEKMNAALIEGIRVNRAEIYRIPGGSKKHSLSSLLWGFGYADPDGETAYVPASEEKAYRKKHLDAGAALFSLHRTCVLAKNIIIDDSKQSAALPWASYFDVYRHLYMTI
ncbi:MAG: TIGR03960 family B12-binding radical SAM protein [Treponema sp.]|jgi:radical SAM family uncharacterized protein|nr:TIGR03960 family B12-binding radical SAM protein [Treponema sp.]